MSEKTDYSASTTRNILTLEERVRAIREFDRRPIYQRVADKMNCSAKQIKNIIDNRESILLYYASKTGQCQLVSVKQQDRRTQIGVLNKVMYEWIRRTQSREDIGRITTKLIRTIALDVKNYLAVPSFYPNKYWLEIFMNEYNLSADDLLNHKKYDCPDESKEHLSLKISDIIEDVKKSESKNFKIYTPNYEQKDLRYEYKPDDSPLMFENSNSAIDAGDDFNEVRVLIEDEEPDEVDYGSRSMTPPPAKMRKTDIDADHKKQDSASNGEKHIETYEEALRHLKPLEDFVLLEENFRAIGVISQLEAIFKNPSKYQID